MTWFQSDVWFQEVEATVVDGNGTETGHIIVTTIGGRNGQPKQVTELGLICQYFKLVFKKRLGLTTTFTHVYAQLTFLSCSATESFFLPISVRYFLLRLFFFELQFSSNIEHWVSSASTLISTSKEGWVNYCSEPILCSYCNWELPFFGGQFLF